MAESICYTVIRAVKRSQIGVACLQRSGLFYLTTSLHLLTNMKLHALQNYHNATLEALLVSAYLLCLGEGILRQTEKGSAAVSNSIRLF